MANDDNFFKVAEKLRKEAQEDAESMNFFRGDSRFTDAVDKYDKAADKYKLAEDWDNAAKCSAAAAAVYEKHLLKKDRGSVRKHLKLLEDGAQSLYKYSPKEGAVKLKEVAVMKMSDNDFNGGADIFKKLADAEADADNSKEAMECYSEAHMCYKQCNAPTKAALCKTRCAELQVASEKFQEAYDLYMELSENCISDNVMKHEVHNFMFKALLCAFIIGAQTDDMGFVRIKNAACEKLERTWEDEKNCKTLKKLITCYEERNPKEFRKVYAFYKKGSPVDEFMESTLAKVLKALQGVEGGAINVGVEAKADLEDDIDLS